MDRDTVVMTAAAAVGAAAVAVAVLRRRGREKTASDGPAPPQLTVDPALAQDVADWGSMHGMIMRTPDRSAVLHAPIAAMPRKVRLRPAFAPHAPRVAPGRGGSAAFAQLRHHACAAPTLTLACLLL